MLTIRLFARGLVTLQEAKNYITSALHQPSLMIVWEWNSFFFNCFFV